MKHPSANAKSELAIRLPSEREIELTRSFDAPRALVFEAHVDPELIPRWLGGPPGWTMVECRVEARVGGSYRYAWRHERGETMGLSGRFLEFAPPERLVASERFDEPWYPGEAVGTSVFAEQAGRTTLTLTLRYESKAARDAVLATPALDGMGHGYRQLASLLASVAAERRAKG